MSKQQQLARHWAAETWFIAIHIVVLLIIVAASAQGGPRDYILRRQEAGQLSHDRRLRRNGLPRFCERRAAPYLPLIGYKHFSTRNKVLAHYVQIWYKHHPPRRHDFNKSLQFRLGSGGIDLHARSKSFGTRSRRSLPFGTFTGFLRTSFSNFLGKAGEMVFPGDSSCWSGGELIRTGIVSPRSKALSKIFENFEPQISEKDGEMKQGTKGQITTAGWSAISNFSRS